MVPLDRSLETLQDEYVLLGPEGVLDFFQLSPRQRVCVSAIPPPPPLPANM